MSYRLSVQPLPVSKVAQVLHFAFYRVPTALLSLTNCALEFYILVMAWSGTTADFGGSLSGLPLLYQFLFHQLGFLIGLIMILAETAGATTFHSWLGFNPKLLLFPPFGLLFFALAPAILWLFPIPATHIDGTHYAVVAEVPASTRSPVEEVETEAAPSLHWISLWQQYNAKWNNAFLLMESILGLFHLLLTVFGLHFFAVSKRGIDSFEYQLVSFAVGVRIAYIIFMFMPKFALSSYFRAGLFKICWFAHDMASNWYCFLICFNIGISVWAADPRKNSVAPGLPQAVGIRGDAAEWLVTVFRWTLVAVLCLGFICDLVAVWRVVLGASRPTKCASVGVMMLSAGAVLLLQLFRFLAPSIVLLDQIRFGSFSFSPIRPGTIRPDRGALARLFAFASSNPKARDRRVYYLLREELGDRVEAEQTQRRAFGATNGRGASDEGDQKEDESEGMSPVSIRPRLEPPIPQPIGLLNQVLSLRPFSRPVLRSLARKHQTDFLPGVAPQDIVSSWFRFFGHVGFTILGLFSTALPFFFLPQPSDGLMMSLFILKCVALLLTLSLIPSARSFLQFQLELIPGLARLDSEVFRVVTSDQFPQMVALSRIEGYFRRIDVAAAMSRSIPVELLPTDVAGRIGAFLPGAALELGPVRGIEFDENYASPLYDLPPHDALPAVGVTRTILVGVSTHREYGYNRNGTDGEPIE